MAADDAVMRRKVTALGPVGLCTIAAIRFTLGVFLSWQVAQVKLDPQVPYFVPRLVLLCSNGEAPLAGIGKA